MSRSFHWHDDAGGSFVRVRLAGSFGRRSNESFPPVALRRQQTGGGFLGKRTVGIKLLIS